MGLEGGEKGEKAGEKGLGEIEGEGDREGREGSRVAEGGE